tara:strand:- start:102 stop:314 length:213 start_codon:yes stop_codon:yes gene_type:complete
LVVFHPSSEVAFYLVASSEVAFLRRPVAFHHPVAFLRRPVAFRLEVVVYHLEVVGVEVVGLQVEVVSYGN